MILLNKIQMMLLRLLLNIPPQLSQLPTLSVSPPPLRNQLTQKEEAQKEEAEGRSAWSVFDWAESLFCWAVSLVCGATSLFGGAASLFGGAAAFGGGWVAECFEEELDCLVVTAM